MHNHVVGMITRKDLMPFMMQERLEKLLEQTTSEHGDGKHEATTGDVRRKSADSVEEGVVCRPTPYSVENAHYRGPYVLLPTSSKNSSTNNRTALDGLREEVEGDYVTSSVDETGQLRDAGVRGDAVAVQIVVSEPPNNSKQEWV